MKLAIIPATLSIAFALSACAKPSNIECPTIQLPQNGVLVDTPADIKTFGELFMSGYSGNIIAEAIRTVREKYAGATDAEVRNFLIAAYCPIARKTAGGEEAQQANMQQFEAALSANLAQ